MAMKHCVMRKKSYIQVQRLVGSAHPTITERCEDGVRVQQPVPDGAFVWERQC